mmetsp:Transcript_14286/g.21133  ORF Transcript_14286/g.21133 Transcript_14286/m.21133 type:complete len:650 (-) Transcript_14286:1366-3315(-)|eukprot:CAMPEP_0116014314 /NCGR_PEP_ID=MMETSP0321-20121206/6208_1 /TAXON_ID=163516 /ORGANISM="Leptocylindrus danicus var. danicus, Strain B650" /LENGTH=649 /DNA_ID=CAMNT_0003483951 /DNA_START=1322 /DNA_END=3271 /DNA_ORIENTATION=+
MRHPAPYTQALSGQPINSRSSNAKSTNQEALNRFLTRSLNRCDVELAAIEKLHTSLHELKTKLDSKDVNVRQEFQWKMLLRKRLLNRLARRLNRLAHTMDNNEIVAPPTIPKYGDARYEISNRTEELGEYKKRKKSKPDDADGAVEIEYDIGFEDPPPEVDDDIENFRYEGGVGAMQRGLSTREKMSEFKRWRAELLQKIPNQCTFDELHSDNFCPEIEDFLEAEAEKKKEEEEAKNKPEKEESDDDDDEKDEPTAKRPKKEKAPPPEFTKPFSLKPIPSFVDQDFARISALHQDMLDATTRSFMEKKMTGVVNDYNRCLAKSNDLSNHMMKLRSDLQRVLMWSQQNNTQQTQQYQMQVQIAKQKYDNYRNTMEIQQLSKRKQMEFMAEEETKKQNLGSFLQLSVGATLMSIVDTIEMRHNGEVLNANVQQPKLGATLISAVNGVIRNVTNGGCHPETHFLAFNQANTEPYRIRKFVPPPQPQQDNRQMMQMQQHAEQQARTDYARTQQMYQQSEAQRDAMWKKFLKIKAEFEPSEIRKRMVLNQPLPSVKSQRLTMAVMPSYGSSYSPYTDIQTGRHRQAPTSGGKNDKYSGKYSADRARMFPDGSVAPAEPLKKSADGLYLRPTGGQRKGMTWDAKRGRWAPVVGKK